MPYLPNLNQLPLFLKDPSLHNTSISSGTINSGTSYGIINSGTSTYDTIGRSTTSIFDPSYTTSPFKHHDTSSIVNVLFEFMSNFNGKIRIDYQLVVKEPYVLEVEIKKIYGVNVINPLKKLYSSFLEFFKLSNEKSEHYNRVLHRIFFTYEGAREEYIFDTY